MWILNHVPQHIRAKPWTWEFANAIVRGLLASSKREILGTDYDHYNIDILCIHIPTWSHTASACATQTVIHFSISYQPTASLQVTQPSNTHVLWCRHPITWTGHIADSKRVTGSKVNKAAFKFRLTTYYHRRIPLQYSRTRTLMEALTWTLTTNPLSRGSGWTDFP